MFDDDDQGQFENIGWSVYVLSPALQICRLVSNRSITDLQIKGWRMWFEGTLRLQSRHFNLLEEAFMSPQAGDNLEVDLDLWRPLEVVSCFEKLAEPIFICNGLN